MKNLFLLLLGFTVPAAAVRLAPEGVGEVLIIPYYTVNNDLNTLVTLTNTSPDTKAVKITFREGLNGEAVFSYNVYLGAYDMWSFALVSAESEQPGFAGEQTVRHISEDTSCTPFLDTTGTEFWIPDENSALTSLMAGREGHIEVLEMGTLIGRHVAWIDHGGTGVPARCDLLENVFVDTTTSVLWNPDVGGDLQNEVDPATGGLFGEVSLINVNSGRNYAYQAVALTGFFAEGETHHRLPDDASLSLDAAVSNAWFVGKEVDESQTINGARNKPINIMASSPIDAVSAVLMAAQVKATYDLLPEINGQTEWVISMPTRRFYQDESGALPPFNQVQGLDNCPESSLNNRAGWYPQVRDRSGQVVDLFDANEPRSLCGSTQVVSLVLPEAAVPEHPVITGSAQADVLVMPDAGPYVNGSLNGWFDSAGLLVSEDDTGLNLRLDGLPAIGLVLQSYTNGSAQPGLLAQYASAHPLLHRTHYSVLPTESNHTVEEDR
jgi:hypothetical protein